MNWTNASIAKQITESSRDYYVMSFCSHESESLFAYQETTEHFCNLAHIPNELHSEKLHEICDCEVISLLSQIANTIHERATLKLFVSANIIHFSVIPNWLISDGWHYVTHNSVKGKNVFIQM